MNESESMVGLGNSMPPKAEQSEIEAILSRFDAKLGQLEKSIAYAKEVFRGLDIIANKLNPDAFHKNQPKCEDAANNGIDAAMNIIPESVKSGSILTLRQMVQHVEAQTNDLDIFIRDEARPTVNFFKTQI